MVLRAEAIKIEEPLPIKSDDNHHSSHHSSLHSRDKQPVHVNKASHFRHLASKGVCAAICKRKSEGLPIVRYDEERKQPYLEQSDGRREYNWE